MITAMHLNYVISELWNLLDLGDSHPIFCTRRYDGLWPPTSSSCGGLVAFGHLEGPSGPLQLQMLGGPFANNFYLGHCHTRRRSSLSFKATEELHPSMDSGEHQLQFGICHFCLSGLLDAQKCEKPLATIKDNFLDPNKPFFFVRDHQIFLANLSHIQAYVHAKFQTI